jgi:hypothetical protein
MRRFGATVCYFAMFHVGNDADLPKVYPPLVYSFTDVYYTLAGEVIGE